MRTWPHIKTKATAFIAVAFVVFGCGGKLKEADKINLAETPTQVVNDMFAVNTADGVVKQRFESPVMLKFVTDSIDYDLFPNGLHVFGYTEEGLLETIIMADKAKHVASGKRSSGETNPFATPHHTRKKGNSHATQGNDIHGRQLVLP